MLIIAVQLVEFQIYGQSVDIKFSIVFAKLFRKRREKRKKDQKFMAAVKIIRQPKCWHVKTPSDANSSIQKNKKSPSNTRKRHTHKDKNGEKWNRGRKMVEKSKRFPNISMASETKSNGKLQWNSNNININADRYQNIFSHRFSGLRIGCEIYLTSIHFYWNGRWRAEKEETI